MALVWGWRNAAAGLCPLALLCAPPVFAQTSLASLAAQSTPEPVSQALLFGAAYAASPEAPQPGHSVGMVFVPGRGLITFDATGKSSAEIMEAETEAIGLADARAVQAQIDARHAQDVEQEAVAFAEADQQALRLRVDGRTAPGLNFNSIGGSRSQAGGVLPLNRSAVKDQVARVLGLHDGAALKNRSRVYMFAALSGRGVGVNLLHDATSGEWSNAGLTSDKGGFIGQRQTGIAWRKGTMQAALSLIDQKTHAQLLGITTIRDKRVMLSFTMVSKVK